MIVNDYRLEWVNARLLSRDIQSSKIEQNVLTPRGNISTPLLSTKFLTRTLTVELEFRGTIDERIESRSTMLGVFTSTDELEIEFKATNNFKFKGYLLDHILIESNILYDIVEYTLEVEQVSMSSLSGSYTGATFIYLPSNKRTPVTFRIRLFDNIGGKLVIQGFKDSLGRPIAMELNNVNIGDDIIIDGHSCVVEVNGVNRFVDYDSWGFPSFQQGQNYINVNSTSPYEIFCIPRWL